MKVKELLSQVAFRQLWIRVEQQDDEISEDECKELYILLSQANELVGIEWYLSLSERDAFLYQEREEEKFFPLQNFNHHTLANAVTVDEQVKNMGIALYISHLLLAWKGSTEFFGKDEPGCIEPIDHLPPRYTETEE